MQFFDFARSALANADVEISPPKTRAIISTFFIKSPIRIHGTLLLKLAGLNERGCKGHALLL
jgi:hypothetical protein